MMDDFAQTREGQLFFRNVGRISTSLDRIASALEKRGASSVGEAVNILRDIRENEIIVSLQLADKLAKAEITLERALDEMGVVK